MKQGSAIPWRLTFEIAGITVCMGSSEPGLVVVASSREKQSRQPCRGAARSVLRSPRHVAGLKVRIDVLLRAVKLVANLQVAKLARVHQFVCNSIAQTQLLGHLTYREPLRSRVEESLYSYGHLFVGFRWHLFALPPIRDTSF
jgi:hypothetical protein